MSNTDITVEELDTMIDTIDKRIEAVKKEAAAKKEKGGISLDVFNELSSLRKAKEHYELERCDILNGTHKVQRKELEKKVVYLAMHLGEAKDRLRRSSVFSYKKCSDEVVKYEIAIAELQKYIIELEDEDRLIEEEGISLS